jgi:hypothetical protein
MIWQHAIGNQKLHIIHQHKRMGHAVMDEAYWRQHHAKRPDHRASSWIYTYGSLPTTKQLADQNLCDLLVTCSQVYHEAIDVLYPTNTFVFRDLRTVAMFKRSVAVEKWHVIREVETYAAFYRREDVDDAVEACGLLQLEAWSGACDVLGELPNLRRLSISIARPKYLDSGYLTGRCSDAYAAVLAFVARCRVEVSIEVYLPGGVMQEGVGQRWRLDASRNGEMRKLEVKLLGRGVDCRIMDRIQRRYSALGSD